MKHLFLLGFFFGAVNVQAAEVVWSFNELEALQKDISDKPIYLKRRLLRDVRISTLELGKPATPYYKEEGQTKRIYKNSAGACHEITVYSSDISAVKANCDKDDLSITLNNESYKMLNKLQDLEEREISFGESEYTRSLEAYNHQQMHFEENSRGEMPVSQIDVLVKEGKKIVIQKEKISINSNVVVERSPYVFLSAKVEDKKQTMNLDLDKGDLVFKSESGYLLLKRYQPRPLNFKLQALSDSYIDYLERIEDQLFEYQGTKRCFRDSVVLAQAYDCDNLIFKKQSAVKYTEFSLIKVNIDEESVEVL